MLRVEIIRSGSQDGNCAVIDNGKTKMMIDIGHCYGGWKAVEEELAAKGYDHVEIDALLITHRHLDHIRQLNAFLKKHPYGSKVVYTSKKVARDIEWEGKHKAFSEAEANLLALDKPNVIGTFEVTPRVLKHGGMGKSRISECIGFEIYDTVNDKWVLFATDTCTLKPFKGAKHEWDLLCVECNYDEKTLDLNYFGARDIPANFATYTRTKEDHLSVEQLTHFLVDEGIRCPIIELHESHNNKIKKFDKSKYSIVL